MNDLSTSSPTFKLISQIIRQELNPHDISPPVIFITAVLYVLNGVIFADQSVEEEEKARLEKIINNLCPEGSQARDLAQVINNNIQQQSLYNNINNLDTLTEGFSESDKLLLLSLGYEMSMADGNLDKTEKRHLKTIGTFLEIDDKFHSFLEFLFVDPTQLDANILKDFTNLLDPARFHHLDEIFVFAANQILSHIPSFNNKSKQVLISPKSIVDSYESLDNFKVKFNEIKGSFERIKLLVSVLIDNNLISADIIQSIELLNKDFGYLYEFRIAVIGGFSQGKSSLLNVLLGDRVQPDDISPCSSTITALRYGEQVKVTCFYNDGRSEVIPFNDYVRKASLDESIAIGNPAQGLEENQIDKIILEHPNLTLCKQGIEILDSPGLNEHPKRSEITRKLLNEVDGVIFLTNPLQVMTQADQEILDETISVLNSGNIEEVIYNLFIVVNKWDLVRNDEEKEKTKKRVLTICKAKNISCDNNRVHYLSAYESFKAMTEGSENEYLKSFQDFVYSLESFLGDERGKIKIKRISEKINSLIKSTIDNLEKSKHILADKSQDAKKEKQTIINQIGEITGRDTKIKAIANTIRDETIDEISDSYDEWLELLPDRLANRAQNWSSEHGAIMSRDKLVADYVRQFNQDLSSEFNNWITKNLKNRILKRSIREFRQAVNDELKSLDNEASNLSQSNNDSSDSFKYSFTNYNLEDVGIGGDLLFAGLGLAVGVPLFIFAGPIVATIGAILGGGSIFNATFKALDLNDTIKGKVFEIGLENFFKSSESTDKINELIYQVFKNEVLVVENFIQDLISRYENRIQIIDQKNKKDQKETENIVKTIDKTISDLQQIQFSLD